MPKRLDNTLKTSSTPLSPYQAEMIGPGVSLLAALFSAEKNPPQLARALDDFLRPLVAQARAGRLFDNPQTFQQIPQEIAKHVWEAYQKPTTTSAQPTLNEDAAQLLQYIDLFSNKENLNSHIETHRIGVPFHSETGKEFEAFYKAFQCLNLALKSLTQRDTEHYPVSDTTPLDCSPDAFLWPRFLRNLFAFAEDFSFPLVLARELSSVIAGGLGGLGGAKAVLVGAGAAGAAGCQRQLKFDPPRGGGGCQRQLKFDPPRG